MEEAAVLENHTDVPEDLHKKAPSLYVLFDITHQDPKATIEQCQKLFQRPKVEHVYDLVNLVRHAKKLKKAAKSMDLKKPKEDSSMVACPHPIDEIEFHLTFDADFEELVKGGKMKEFMQAVKKKLGEDHCHIESR